MAERAAPPIRTRHQAGRTLLLMRHAKSSWDDPGLADKDRPLNGRGQKAAKAMAPVIARWRPDHIVCSTAQRTRETLQPLLGHLQGPLAITLTDALYETGQAAYMQLLRGLPAAAQTALLLGHNPSLEDTARHLIGRADPSLLARIEDKLPTGTLMAIQCPVDAWEGLKPGTCTLLDIVRPADLSD